MYKSITLFALSLLLSVHLQAQSCIPGAINPDTAIILPVPYNFDSMTGGLDSTCVGLFYEQVLTTLVPAAIPIAGTEVGIDSMVWTTLAIHQAAFFTQILWLVL